MEWIPGAGRQDLLIVKIQEDYTRIPSQDLDYFLGQWCNCHIVKSDCYISGGSLDTIDRETNTVLVNNFGKKQQLVICETVFYFKTKTAIMKGYLKLRHDIDHFKLVLDSYRRQARQARKAQGAQGGHEIDIE